jgi:regulator of sirC expression with transglutaminase-like and TPR domain
MSLLVRFFHQISIKDGGRKSCMPTARYHTPGVAEEFITSQPAATAMSIIHARVTKPHFCRLEAWEYFVEQLPELDKTEGLLRASIAVAMHALDDIDPEAVERRLRRMSETVRERSPSESITALQANLHAVLFDEEGFIGNLQNYYNALNSYVPAVLNTRQGLPVSLAVIYKVVGEWAGLSIEGLNAPGHFLVRVWTGDGWMIVDPFFRGQMLTRDEAFDRIDKIARRKWPRNDEYLAPATHVQWLTRMIGNLRQLFATEGRRDDLAAMTELGRALNAYYPS